MNMYAPLLCSEFKMFVQQVLDGDEVSESSRRRIREHRDSCDQCCAFHDSLLGVTAIAPEIPPPEEFRNPQAARLWNEIVLSIDEPRNDDDLPPKPPLAKSVSLLTEPVNPDAPPAMLINRLDPSKIDVDSKAGHIKDLAKFLFEPDEFNSFGVVLDEKNTNKRIDRISKDVHSMLAKLQDVVATIPHVVGTMVLSPDGNVVDSRLGEENGVLTRDQIGLWSTAAYHNAQAAAEQFGYPGVKQIVSHTENGAVIVANLNGLTLVVLVEGSAPNAWAAVDKISTLTK